jgi:hypothetical protein
MNERIEELSRVAHSAADSTYAKGPDAIWLKEYNKKFTELIVKECAYIASHNVMNISTYSDAEFVSDLITQHFGVK